MSKFFCDSLCELWFTKIDELGVNLINMSYSLGSEVTDYDCGRNTDFKKFYNALRKGKDSKTQSLNMQNYIDYFEPVLASGEDVIYVHFSGEMSGTFNHMNKAISYLKEKYPNRTIRAVDTKSVSIGSEIIVYEAAKLWKAGATDDEVVEFVINHRDNFVLRFIAEDLKYLKKGGRLSATGMVVGTVLNIKPIIGVNSDGVLVKVGTAQGVKGGIKKLVDEMKELGSDVYNHPVIVAHADAENLVEELKVKLFEEFGDRLVVWEQPIGPTVGAHCGPGTLGIAYHGSRRK